MSSSRQISAPAALRETMELADYYRNRNLILAEELAIASQRLAALEQDLAAAKALADAAHEADGEAG